MIDRLINTSLRNWILTLVAVIGLAGGGYWVVQNIAVDAFPDVSPPLVRVFTESPGLSPVDVEKQVSYPIEIAMYGLPNLERVQSKSIFGLSRVTVYFEEGTDIYFARRLVMERLQKARDRIPKGLGTPQLGPITTALGNIMMYEVKSDSTADHSLTDLRSAQDWIVKPRLRTVPNVTGVLSLGGYVKQYQVQLDMDKLLARDLTVSDVRTAVGANNRNVGGSFVERGGEEYIVRGYGWIRPGQDGLSDIRNIEIGSHDGTPVHVGDVGTVAFGPEIRRGSLITSTDSTKAQESVGGFVQKLINTNTQAVLENVEQQIASINESLPEGMTAEPFYSQGNMVNKAVGTVTNALGIGAVLVLLVLYLFMGDVRSTIIIMTTIPIAFLVAFIGMYWTGLSANLMTLGALAISIGMIGDGATVVVENVYRLLQERDDLSNVSITRIVGEAAQEVSRPVVFSTSIIIIVFLPLFTLQGVEGKLFSPMAYTITFALLGAVVLAVTFAPVAASVLLSTESVPEEPGLVSWLKARYRPILAWAYERPRMIVGGALALLVGTLALFPFLGAEFKPTLREGTYAVRAVMPPGANLESTNDYAKRLQESFKQFPEVNGVFTRVGRAEVGGDPEPVNVLFNVVDLKPLGQWEQGRDYEELQTAMAEQLSEDVPGLAANFTQPIQLRTDELLSGVRSQVVASLYGPDLDTLSAKARQMAEVIRTVDGAVDVRPQQQGGKPQVLVSPTRDELARLGISIDDFLETVETGIGGSTAGKVFEGIRRYDTFVRLQEGERDKVEQIRQLPIRTEKGAVVPLEQVATVDVFTGVKQISRNKASRRSFVQLNVRGRDMGSVVHEIQRKVKAQVDLPPGYFTEYGGQFENQRRAMNRLYVVVPITLALIFLMLFLTFGSARYASLIFLNVPFAVIGGIFALWVGGLYVSVPAAVGFIAVFGVAVLNGVVLVSYINDLRAEGASIKEAAIQGAELRLRPVLMTALTTSLGLLPLLLASDVGSNVQRPLAAVVIGGLVTSTLLTLLVLPSIYRWFAEEADAAAM
ncbi:efflux RND transporter permease subunit [Salinibacter altiplanensis]|uniref:efflux RND transporter permease subunit n=1 Tax=Salinibacter altiplanensis TaxID=1803181 RepID=UPI000C9FF8F7|nr:CusA/CzcA family heavy metal efflux RND transporter [Salinibacter altiplanensis]